MFDWNFCLIVSRLFNFLIFDFLCKTITQKSKGNVKEIFGQNRVLYDLIIKTDLSKFNFFYGKNAATSILVLHRQGVNGHLIPSLTPFQKKLKILL